MRRKGGTNMFTIGLIEECFASVLFSTLQRKCLARPLKKSLHNSYWLLSQTISQTFLLKIEANVFQL